MGRTEMIKEKPHHVDCFCAVCVWAFGSPFFGNIHYTDCFCIRCARLETIKADAPELPKSKDPFRPEGYTIVEQGLANQKITFAVCDTCSVPVYNRQIHDAWHEEMSNAASRPEATPEESDPAAGEWKDIVGRYRLGEDENGLWVVYEFDSPVDGVSRHLRHYYSEKTG